eukprot:gene30459-39704_t
MKFQAKNMVVVTVLLWILNFALSEGDSRIAKLDDIKFGTLDAQIEDEMEALKSRKHLSLKEAILQLAIIGSQLPTQAPTIAPMSLPTVVPTTLPTILPTTVPSFVPTFAPTAVPTVRPTFSPSVAPSKSPIYTPTRRPTSIPSEEPTVIPTEEPTFIPSFSPTAAPSFTPEPTASPTRESVPAAGSVVAFQLTDAQKITNCSSYLRDEIVLTTVRAIVIASKADVGVFWKCVEKDGSEFFYNGNFGFFIRVGGGVRRLFTEQLTEGQQSRRQLQSAAANDYTLIVNVSRVLPKNTLAEVVQQEQTALFTDIKAAFVDQTFTKTLTSQAQLENVPELLNTGSSAANQTVFIGEALVDPPTAAPTDAPTAPSAQPSFTLSNSPRYKPTKAPVTAKPSTTTPSASPSEVPTETPTIVPSHLPSAKPSIAPSATPSSIAPSAVPTFSPSGPSIAPTAMPSGVPTTIEPSGVPTTEVPTRRPSRVPSAQPSRAPTHVPSAKPSR